LVETFFSKPARTPLRGIRVGSKDEMKARIGTSEGVNAKPVAFRWKNKPDTASVA
jgi:hypothetical protein